jgi:3-oxoacyl-[acyl-carrier-protein] synthase II
VVITGYGMITPLGRNTEETFEKARQGTSGIDYITSFDTTGLPCRIGGQVKEGWLDAPQDPRAARFESLASRGARLMAAAAGEAARQARLGEIPNRESIGIALGSHGENPSVQEVVFLHRFYQGDGRWDLKGLMEAGGYP